MIGARYGQLTILRDLGRDWRSNRTMLVRCDCGTEKEARLSSMERGDTVSCGCWKRLPRKTADGLRKVVRPD